METSIANILENYSIEDLNRLKQLIDDVETRRKETSSNALELKKFKSEYEHYIENNFSESYLKSIKLSFNHLINFCGPDKKLTDLTVRDADEFKCHIMQNAPMGHKNYFRNLRAAFNKALDWEMILSNPFSKIKLTKHQQVIPKFLNKDQLEAILNQSKSKILAELFLFAFYTGCRLGEVVMIKWGNINFKENFVIIGDKNCSTKNRKSRIVPLCRELFNKLLERENGRSNNEYVFSKGNGFPFNRDYVSRYFKKCVRLAQLDEEIHFHSLRHSFASNLAIEGVPLITIKELLGHSSIVTTQIYSHCDRNSLRQAIQKFD